MNVGQLIDGLRGVDRGHPVYTWPKTGEVTGLHLATDRTDSEGRPVAGVSLWVRHEPEHHDGRTFEVGQTTHRAGWEIRLREGGTELASIEVTPEHYSDALELGRQWIAGASVESLIPPFPET